MKNIVIKIIKGILILVPAVSMVVVSNMYFPFITGKSFLFRLAVELAFCLYLGVIFVDKSYRPKWNRLLITFAAFTGIMLVADIFAVDSTKAIFSNFERMEGFILLAHLFVYFIVLTSVFRNKRDWILMLFSTTAVSIFMTLFGFLQHFGGATIDQGGDRLDGTLGNSSYMATFMVFHIFFLLYLWSVNGTKVKGIADSALVGTVLYVLYYIGHVMGGSLPFSKAGGWILAFSLLFAIKLCWYRWGTLFSRFEKLFVNGLYSFLILAQITILYYTATRGATFGLLGGVVIAALYLAYYSKENKRVRHVSFGIIASLFIFVCGFYSLRNSDFVQNSSVLNRFANISLNDPTQARAIIWPMAIEAFKAHPVLGWGQDNFIHAFAKYYKPEMIEHEPWFDRTHNTFLDWLVAGGVLGFAAYILLYIFALIQILKSTVFQYREKAILLGLFFAYAFLSLFIFDNLISYYLFILLLGLSTMTPEREEEKHSREEMHPGILLSSLLIFVVVALAINLNAYRQNLNLTQALSQQSGGYTKNLELIKAAVNGGPTGRFESLEQMISLSTTIIGINSIPDKDKSTFVLETYNAFNAFIKDNPNDVRGVAMLGTFLTDIGLYKDAIPFLERAQTLSSEKQQIYYALAKAYLIKSDQEKNKDDINKALSYLKQAYEFNTNMAEPRIIYLNALVSTGHIDEAKIVLDKISNPETTLDPAVVTLLKQKGVLK